MFPWSMYHWFKTEDETEIIVGNDSFLIILSINTGACVSIVIA